MPKASLKQCVEVSYEKIHKSPVREKLNTYYQIMYFVAGAGCITLNGNRNNYEKGSLYLITPDDNYRFDIDGTTEFMLIRFSNAFIREYRWKCIDHVETLLHHASHLRGCIMKSASDRFLVERAIESMIHVLHNKNHYDEDLLFHFVNTLIVIAARNISSIKPSKLSVTAESKIQEIITHIQTNINSPEKLKASVIGKQFGISETYLGSYFKNQSGETIQHYISNYKLRLIEHRLRFSDMRINEIAFEFGFTDESHLNKFFKKHRVMNLTEFRKTKQVS